jgi:adenosylcobinamide-GDP ribazoletransferase
MPQPSRPQSAIEDSLIRQFLGAVQYLTIIPVRTRTAEPGRSAIFFPLIGLLLGSAGGLVLEQGRGYLPFTLLALLVLAFWTLITGGLHERGFADAADAFRAWRPPEKILEILKDSRIGAHGAMALLMLVLVRWQALSSMTVDAVPALGAALALGRSGVVGLAWIVPAATDGSGARFAAHLRSWIAVAVVAQAIAVAMWPGGRAPSFLLGGTIAIVLLARAYFSRRIGGMTGGCLGATEQVVETWCLLVFACPPCTS